jgi:hypothetical protein
MMLPGEGVGIVVMTNTDGGRVRMDVLRVFRDAVVKALRPPTGSELDREE